MSDTKGNKYSDWLARCPKCGSYNVIPSDKYKNIFHKFKPTEQLYVCQDCGEEFWY